MRSIGTPSTETRGDQRSPTRTLGRLFSQRTPCLDVLKPESALVGDFAVTHDCDAQTRVLAKGKLFSQPGIDPCNVTVAEGADVIESGLTQWLIALSVPKNNKSCK